MINHEENKKIIEAATTDGLSISFRCTGKSTKTGEKKYSLCGYKWVPDFDDWGFTKENAEFITHFNPSYMQKYEEYIERLEDLLGEIASDPEVGEYFHRAKEVLK